jgi:hypothetical protein
MKGESYDPTADPLDSFHRPAGAVIEPGVYYGSANRPDALLMLRESLDPELARRERERAARMVKINHVSAQFGITGKQAVDFLEAMKKWHSQEQVLDDKRHQACILRRQRRVEARAAMTPKQTADERAAITAAKRKEREQRNYAIQKARRAEFKMEMELEALVRTFPAVAFGEDEPEIIKAIESAARAGFVIDYRLCWSKAACIECFKNLQGVVGGMVGVNRLYGMMERRIAQLPKTEP